MYSDDPVLVGVINRRRDFELLRKELWYRIPIFSAPLCIDAVYVAFYLSRAFADANGSIGYYARRTGFELARRRDLLPIEANHPRADRLYFKLQFRELERKMPPITNPTHRPVSFIYTSWERLNDARTIADLYRKT
ncbi:MAG: hypothetical protein ACYDBJ_16935 [Aggregatilineales bacterium]